MAAIYKIDQIRLTLSEIESLASRTNPPFKIFEIDEDSPALTNLLRAKIARKISAAVEDVGHIEILKRSLDARGNREPLYVFSLAFSLTCIQPNLTPHASDPQPIQISTDGPCLPHPPVIVGAGPAGIFAAWRLAEYGFAPIVLERGPIVEERSKRWFQFLKGGAFDAEANLLFGEGGAGAYSDGKLTTRIKDARVKDVLKIFVECGAPVDTLYDAKPHLGSNYLPAIVRRMRKRVMDMGGKIQFDTQLTSLHPVNPGHENLKIKSIGTNQGEIPTDVLLLGPGHSARDTYRMLAASQLALSAKPFQMGVRLEHSQDLINRNQFGKYTGNPNLPVAEYQLVANQVSPGIDLFSFCMCPGGEILPAMEKPGYMCVNGASKRARSSSFANSGFVITIAPERFENNPIVGIELQEKYEALAFAAAGANFAAPGQTIADFLAGRLSSKLLPTSYPLAVTSVDFAQILPDYLTEALKCGIPMLNKKIPGFTEGMMLGPEARSCSPVRMDRDPETFESINYGGIYPIGEGAGYAGGIMSAAVDGLRAAEAIIARYRPQP